MPEIPIFAQAQEVVTIQQLEQLLSTNLEQVELTAPDAAALALPRSVATILQKVIALLAAGSGVTVVPFYFKALGSSIFTILEL